MEWKTSKNFNFDRFSQNKNLSWTVNLRNLSNKRNPYPYQVNFVPFLYQQFFNKWPYLFRSLYKQLLGYLHKKVEKYCSTLWAIQKHKKMFQQPFCKSKEGFINTKTPWSWNLILWWRWSAKYIREELVIFLSFNFRFNISEVRPGYQLKLCLKTN